MTSICVGCGMCCDGTMYRTVSLSEGDPVDILRAAGLVVITTGDETCFRQPCQASNSGQCVVYQDRPCACRAYRCRLLRRLEAGEVSPTDASVLVARTTALRDRVRAALTAWVGAGEWQTLGELYRLMLARLDAMSDHVAARREHAGLLLDVAALRVILARDFEPRDVQAHQPDELQESTPASTGARQP